MKTTMAPSRSRIFCDWRKQAKGESLFRIEINSKARKEGRFSSSDKTKRQTDRREILSVEEGKQARKAKLN